MKRKLIAVASAAMIGLTAVERASLRSAFLIFRFKAGVIIFVPAVKAGFWLGRFVR